MAHATPGFVPAEGDELTARTYPAFFAVLSVLLQAGVTTIAEAAFQDPAWRSGLAPLRPLADLRVIRCATDPRTALTRRLHRAAATPSRRAHPDPAPSDLSGLLRQHRAFARLSAGDPSLDVDTTTGYRPGLAEIQAFVTSPGWTPSDPAGQLRHAQTISSSDWCQILTPIRTAIRFIDFGLVFSSRKESPKQIGRPRGGLQPSDGTIWASSPPRPHSQCYGRQSTVSDERGERAW